jgi:hypothetical protein
MSKLTLSRLYDVLEYDRHVGVFTWKRRPGDEPTTMTWNVRFSGKRAGTVNRIIGYRTLTVDYEHYYEHRLAWFYMTGEWPTHQIDHRNGDRTDNRFVTLRLATAQQNRFNMKPRGNNSGVKGVCWRKDIQKWSARIQCSGKVIYLGVFDDLGEAVNARGIASIKYHGEFAYEQAH